MVSAARATKRPLSVIDRKKSGASRPGREAWLLTAIEMNTGTAARTTRPARLRRRRNISRSSDSRNRGDTGRGRASGRTVASAADIEALPGERDEDVLQGRGVHREAGHREASVHAGRHDLLGGHAGEPADRAGADHVDV